MYKVREKNIKNYIKKGGFDSKELASMMKNL